MKHVSVSPADFSNLDTVSCVLLCKPVFICGMLHVGGGGRRRRHLGFSEIM